MLPRIGTGISGTRSATKNYQTINGNPSAPNDGKKILIKQAEFLDENRIVLYKKGMQLGKGYFITEISSNNSTIFIAAYDVESPESFLIELPEKKAEEIMREFNSDYEKMAKCLQVMNRRLVLLNPVIFTFLIVFRNIKNQSRELIVLTLPQVVDLRLKE